MTSKTYADYIATRPRAERFGSHGLFTDDGVAVNLSKVSEELNLYEGNVWTAIISLRRGGCGKARLQQWRAMAGYAANSNRSIVHKSEYPDAKSEMVCGVS